MRRSILASTAILVSMAMLSAMMLGGCTTTRAASDPSFRASCTLHTIAVNLSPTDSTVYRIAGQLCQESDKEPKSQIVLLLVSGLSYDNRYWDLGYQPDTYSYVYAATRRGYATFNIDRLGVGLSDRPFPTALTPQAQAYTVSQVIARLRGGGVSGESFKTVVGVGHSVGAAMLRYEAGTATDREHAPDYLVLSGLLHQSDPAAMAAVDAALEPLVEDPVFPRTYLPDGYVSIRPSARDDILLHGEAVDPAIKSLEEGLRQAFTVDELASLDLAAAVDPAANPAVRVPTLIVVGQQDRLYCDSAAGLSCASAAAVLAREAAGYSAEACLSAYVVPAAGHAINLHRDAPDAYRYINGWLDRYTTTGSGASAKDGTGCLP